MLKGPFKYDVITGRARRYPKLVTKSDIGQRGYKKVCISFYFSLVFGQRGSS